MMVLMKIAVTGANGFVGSHLVKFLSRKNVEVLGLVRKGREEVVRYCGGEPIAVDYFDVDSLTNAFSGVETVFHFVWSFSKQKVDNVKIGENVLNACENANVREIVFNSGFGVDSYGKNVHATDEYFLSKIKVEETIRNSKLNYFIFRPSTIIGGGDKAIPSDELTFPIIENILQNKEINIVGSGKEIFQPIWIGDVCEIYFECLGRYDKKIIDLVGPISVTYPEYVDLIAREIGKKPKLKFVDENKARKFFSDVLVDIFLLDEKGNHEILEEFFKMKLKEPYDVMKKIIKSYHESR